MEVKKKVSMEDSFLFFWETKINELKFSIIHFKTATVAEWLDPLTSVLTQRAYKANTT